MERISETFTDRAAFDAGHRHRPFATVVEFGNTWRGDESVANGCRLSYLVELGELVLCAAFSGLCELVARFDPETGEAEVTRLLAGYEEVVGARGSRDWLRARLAPPALGPRLRLSGLAA
jgi:hypothetical protein